MLKLTKTGIGLLTKQYRSVLKKCLLLNLGLFVIFANKQVYSSADTCDELYYGTIFCGFTRMDITTYASLQWHSGISIKWERDGKNRVAIGIASADDGAYGFLYLYGVNGSGGSYLGANSFQLNGSSYATGIDFAANVTAGTTNASHLTTTGAVNQLLNNYYYTRTEADARYAKLNESNTFTGDQYLKTGYEDHLGLWFWRYGDAGNITLFSGGQRIIQLDGGAQNIQLYRGDGSLGSVIGAGSFQLNGSSTATGIDFAANVTAGTTNASHLTTTGTVNQLLNYYYTFRVDERVEAIDSASFFQKDFSTLQEVDLHIKNPTHLGAFTRCDEVCPRPSERFSLSLSQEQMFKNNASVDAGTSRHCLRQFGDVVADLLKNTVAKGLRMYEFMNEEVCHA